MVETISMPFSHQNIEPDVCPCGVDICFHPRLQGLRGQHIEWTGIDGGWYALIEDEEDDLQINVRATAPLPNAFPDRQFITDMAVLSHGHSLVVEVQEPYSTASTLRAAPKVSLPAW